MVSFDADEKDSKGYEKWQGRQASRKKRLKHNGVL
jgi:hypothetical protein